MISYFWYIGGVAVLLAGFSYCAKPTEVSVSLDKAVSGGSDEIYLGQTEIVVMSIKFPGGATTGVKIELLPSTMETIFAIGEIINRTVGSDLTSIANSGWYETVTEYPGPEYNDTENPIFYNTRAAFNLGDVNNGGTANTEEASTITIYYEIVYVSMGTYSDGDEYWVSCGMAYSSDSHIWISQFSYNLKGLDSGFVGSNEYSVQSVTEIEDGGKVLTTDLTMKIRKPKAAIKVEALVLTETSDVVPMKIEMASAAKAYGYSFRTNKFLAKQYDSCAFRDTTQQSLELDMGTIVNKESQKSVDVPSDHEIVLRVSWLVTKGSVTGNVYTLGVGVDVDSSEISVANFNVTVVTRNPAASSMTGFTATADGSNVVAAGGVGVALLSLPIPAESLNTYIMTLSTTKKTGTEPGTMLSILSYTVNSRGDNIPCDLDDTVQLLTSNTDSDNPTVANNANMTFSVLNTGYMSTNDLDLKIMVMPLPTATKNNVYELNIDIDGIQKKVEFTVGDLRVYDEDVAYVFNSTLPQGSRIFTGAQFTLEMTVATERNKMPGPMTIELPIPDAAAYVTLVKARTKSKGKNVICPPSGELTVAMSSWNSTLSDNARAVISIPLVCNIQAVDDVNEDKWVIEFDLQMTNHTDLFTSEMAVNFGVGVKFSGNQIFVGGEETKSIPPEDLSAVKIIKSITITDTVLPSAWPGDYQLQWSPDLENFYSTKLEWKAPTSISQTEFTLKRPIVAQHIRLTTPSATGSPAYNYTINSQPKASILEFLGDTAASNNLFKRFMFALDNDIESCLNLPLKSDTEVPPYLIGLIKTQILIDDAYSGGTNPAQSFNIFLTGEGIKCDAMFGPQRIMIWHPKEAMTTPFHGKLSRCPLSTMLSSFNGTSMTRCQFVCSCDSADTCEYIVLAIIHDSTPSGTYNLCDLSVNL